MTLGPKPYYWPTDASYGGSPPLATRAGWMALGLLPFVLWVIFGSRLKFIR
jgi:ferric-chelate reductase